MPKMSFIHPTKDDVEININFNMESVEGSTCAADNIREMSVAAWVRISIREGITDAQQIQKKVNDHLMSSNICISDLTIEMQKKK